MTHDSSQNQRPIETLGARVERYGYLLVVKRVRHLLVIIDTWQRDKRPVGLAYAVTKKFGDDNANQFVVALGWYGFVAIYPLLLVVITIFGFIGAASLGHQIVSTLHEFPVIGSQFNPEHSSKSLQGSGIGLAIGLIGLVYGAQGVTQTVQQAMAGVWNVPQVDRPGYIPRLARSLIALAIIWRRLCAECGRGDAGDQLGS